MQIDRFSQRLTELFPELARGIARHESNHLSRGDITLPQLWLLERLSRHSPAPMHHLAQFLHISRPATTGLIERLVRQGLVRRSHDTGDRRVVNITITAKGHQTLARIWSQKRRAIAAVFGHISAADRAQYLAILQRVVAALSQTTSRRVSR